MATKTPKSYIELTRHIEQLQRQAESLRKSEVDGVIGRINEAIAAYGIKASDLSFGAPAAERATSKQVSKTAKRRTAERKSVRSKRPANGEVAASAADTTAASSDARAPKKRGGKVRYSDGNGHTWSGFGPRPRWLREAVDQGKSLESFAV